MEVGIRVVGKYIYNRYISPKPKIQDSMFPDPLLLKTNGNSGLKITNVFVATSQCFTIPQVSMDFHILSPIFWKQTFFFCNHSGNSGTCACYVSSIRSTCDCQACKGSKSSAQPSFLWMIIEAGSLAPDMLGTDNNSRSGVSARDHFCDVVYSTCTPSSLKQPSWPYFELPALLQ